MWFVLVVGIIVVAGWIFLANSSMVTRTGDTSLDERTPGNVYDNPCAPDDVNDAPFESASDDAGNCDSGSSN